MIVKINYELVVEEGTEYVAMDSDGQWYGYTNRKPKYNQFSGNWDGKIHGLPPNMKPSLRAEQSLIIVGNGTKETGCADLTIAIEEIKDLKIKVSCLEREIVSKKINEKQNW